MTRDASVEVLAEGTHLCFVRRGRWEYATRTGATGIVGIVAITDDERIVLVEQERPPVKGMVIELPAGLAGDEPAAADEPLVEAARRELLEETGYEAGAWSPLIEGLSSPGLTDECVTLFLATGLRKTGSGGGVGSERIAVHTPTIGGLLEWLGEREQAGVPFDFKVLAGLYAWQQRRT